MGNVLACLSATEKVVEPVIEKVVEPIIVNDILPAVEAKLDPFVKELETKLIAIIEQKINEKLNVNLDVVKSQ